MDLLNDIVIVCQTYRRLDYWFKNYINKYPQLFTKIDYHNKILYTIWGSKWIFRLDNARELRGLRAQQIYVDEFIK